VSRHTPVKVVGVDLNRVVMCVARKFCGFGACRRFNVPTDDRRSLRHGVLLIVISRVCRQLC
jgi:hypothetical protein